MIYLDNHATTRCAPEVVAAMLPYFDELYANPSGIANAFGRSAQERVEQARQAIAHGLDCLSEEIVFTSGATESNGLALLGYLARHADGHVITTLIEHPSVTGPVQQAAERGFNVTRLPVDPQGLVDLMQLRESLRDDTRLVSIQWVNNEVGTIQDLLAIAEIVQPTGAVLHVDATQGIGKLPCSLRDIPVDLMSFSGHKIHGPKGIGGLFLRQRGRRIRLQPLASGGGQERGLRSGTLNVPGIVGLQAALELAWRDRDTIAIQVRSLRDYFYDRLRSEIPGLLLNGPDLASPYRLWNNLNCQFPGVEGQTLALLCEELAMSSGSACSAVHQEPSPVLRALGLDLDQVRASLRFGLSRYTTKSEVDAAVESLSTSYRRIKPELG